MHEIWAMKRGLCRLCIQFRKIRKINFDKTFAMFIYLSKEYLEARSWLSVCHRQFLPLIFFQCIWKLPLENQALGVIKFKFTVFQKSGEDHCKIVYNLQNFCIEIKLYSIITTIYRTSLLKYVSVDNLNNFFHFWLEESRVCSM